MRRLKEERDQFKRIWKLRSYSHQQCVPLYCCYLLSFICGYHEYGTESVLKILMDSFSSPIHTKTVSIYFSIFAGLSLLGMSYILFSIPLAYVLGRLVGYKWAMVCGQLLMYIQGFCGGILCAFQIKCESSSLLLLIPFALGFVIMNVNFIQLALEQVDMFSPAVKSSIINWLWLHFFLGRGCTVFVTSSILFWAYPTHAYVIKVGLAVMALSLLLWMPFERGSRGSVLAPLTSIYKVCKEAFGKCQCRCRSRKNPERARPRSNYSQTEFPVDHKPNIFEQASENFGGSFPLEEVREVQKVILIAFMILSHLGILIIYSMMHSAYGMELRKFRIPDMLLNVSHYRPAQGVDYSRANFPLGLISVIGDIATVISIAVLNGVLYVRFPGTFRVNHRIIIGAILGFLTSISSVVIEGSRFGLSNSGGNVSFISAFTMLKNSPVALAQATEQVDLFWCIPQYVLYGIMTAIVIPATSELAGLSTPVKYRPLMFGVYFTVMGLSMVTGGLIILVQMKPDSLWCFFCGGNGPKTGLVTFIITSLLTISLFLLYLILSWLFEKANRVIRPARSEIDTTMFGTGNHGFLAPHLEQNGSHDSN